MSISVGYAGTSILQGIQPTSIECAQLADMGETATGAFTVEDDAAALTLIGYQPLTISESACSQPLLFKGWTFERGYQRDEENAILTSSARTHDVSIIDMNACFGFRQITRTGTGGGNRPAETWQARLTWILGSEYLRDWISPDQSFVVTNTTMMDEADYRGSYPSAVLQDLSDRSGNAYDYFAFWDPASKEVRLFFDNAVESIGDSVLRISNVLSDQDQWTTFGPDKVAKLQRESDQVYSDVCVNYKDGTLKLYRSRPSTYATFVRRSTQIDRPYTNSAATATLQADAWLTKHSVETDRVTCVIRVPAARVGLIQAGQRVQFKAPHMPGYAAFVWMRVVMCTPKPADETATLYDIALELVGSRSVDAPCSMASVEWVADGPTTIKATGAYSPKTTSIPAPSATPAVIIAGLHLRHSYTAGNDYLANMLTVDAPWTMMDSDSDPLDMTYQTHIAGVAYMPWAGGAVPDIVHTFWFTGDPGFARQGEGFVMSVAVATTATAPVQTGGAWAQVTGSHIPLAAPPTEGNLLVLYAFRDGGSGLPLSWTQLHTAYADVNAFDNQTTTVWVRCAEAGESADVPIGASSASRIYHQLSEWEITGTGGGGDTIIPLPPAPGSTTEHTTDPTVDDDSSAGYTVGSRWINTTTGQEFVLVDSTTGAAVWVSTTAISVFNFSTSDGTTTVDPTTELTFVGATLADLGGGVAEVTWSLPSGTPGGELGGTWASPTVDATHSGSAHLALGSTAATAAAGNHTHAASGAVGPLLLIDGHSVPPVFADILTTDDETDFLYGDI